MRPTHERGDRGLPALERHKRVRCETSAVVPAVEFYFHLKQSFSWAQWAHSRGGMLERGLQGLGNKTYCRYGALTVLRVPSREAIRYCGRKLG